MQGHDHQSNHWDTGSVWARAATTSSCRPSTAATATARRSADGGRRTPNTWTKVTVVLFDRQIVFLDRLGADIRAASGVAISRAHVIRALIDALSESDLDLTGTRSEADLRAILTARLGRYRVREQQSDRTRASAAQ